MPICRSTLGTICHRDGIIDDLPQWLNGQSEALLTPRLGVRFPPGVQKDHRKVVFYLVSDLDALLRCVIQGGGMNAVRRPTTQSFVSNKYPHKKRRALQVEVLIKTANLDRLRILRSLRERGACEPTEAAYLRLRPLPRGRR